MGGLEGVVKQLSIGFASRGGKSHIYRGGWMHKNYKEAWSYKVSKLDFAEAMAEVASTIVNYFKNDGGIAYINVLANISTICDYGGTAAPTPKIRNIGILASLDPVAIDRTCYDLFVKENNTGSHEWINQSETLLGLNTPKFAEELGIGTQDYNLIMVNDDNNGDDKNYIWYIVISVVGAAIFIGAIVGIVLYNKKKNKQQILNFNRR